MLMAKHTLRNLSEEQNYTPKIKRKRASISKATINRLAIPVLAIAIIAIATIIANYHTFFKEYYFVTASNLHVAETPNRDLLVTFCQIIIFPLAFGFYAFIRSAQKRQRTLALCCGLTILLAILSPFIVVASLESIAASYSDQTMLTIEGPNDSSCSIIGFNDRNKSNCPDLTHITFSADMPSGVFMPIKDGDNYIAIYLDQTKTIHNFNEQNLKVCTITPKDTQPYRCNDLKFSNAATDEVSDGFYDYSYSGNRLTIKQIDSETLPRKLILF